MSSQGFQQVQKQSQTLVLAPQLRNSLKILQAPAMELRSSILEELQANPLLEELAIESTSIEEHKEPTNETEREAKRPKNGRGDPRRERAKRQLQNNGPLPRRVTNPARDL